MSRWAYSLYASLLLSVLYGLRRYEKNRLMLKKSLRVQQLEGENLRELDQVKTRFFVNISHEFRKPLTLILGQASPHFQVFGHETRACIIMRFRRNLVCFDASGKFDDIIFVHAD